MEARQQPLRVADLRDRRVVVWGYGNEGRAAVRLLLRHGAPSSVAVVVDGPTAPEAVVDLGGVDASAVPVLAGPDADRAITACDVIVKSPGVSPYHGRLAELGRGKEITGGTALWFAETGGARTIGVTGSKGKSTTTSVVAHLWRSLGEDVVLAGNVGRPLLDVLDEELTAAAGGARSRTGARSYALELSSFQSSEVRCSPAVGVLTALFPEHLDWHGSVDRYYSDKCNLFAHRADIRVAADVSNADVARRAATIPGIVAYGTDGGIRVVDGAVVDLDGALLFAPDDLPLRGAHNANNVAGALTALRASGIDLRARLDDLRDAMRTFRPLAHRLEPVGEVGGRLVIDDSLSTAPQAAIAALAAFADRPVGILVGGHDRGVDYRPLADVLAARTLPTWVLGVPESGARIAALVADAVRATGNDGVHVEDFGDFDDAVARAAAVVPVGGVILLSPAAPSFGRFTDYADRGRWFRSLLGLGA